MLTNNNEKILNNMINEVSNYLYEYLKSSVYSYNQNNYEEKNKKILENASKECTYLDEKAKQIVKDKIKEFILNKYEVNEQNVNEIISFDDAKTLDVEFKFSILMCKFRKKFGKNSFTKFVEKYDLDSIRNNEEDCYIITTKDINDCYMREKISLELSEKIDILVQYIYSRYKGYGVIDELLEMNIDGINGGVSGSNRIKNIDEDNSFSNVWIIFKGKSIRLEFLKFENNMELQRICQNIYKFDSPGELSLTEGYKINKMKDGSRVVVIRPPFGEEWMFFIRKFHVSNLTLDDLITHENKEIVITFLKYIMKSCQNVCVTGQQGSGKTTMLLNLIKYIYSFYPIRVCETAFELNLRSKYPNRNICSLQETENISGQEALNLLKKTDGLINVIGEVATDEVASQLIQSGQVASKCTIFTHHANNFKKLIMSLRNSLLKTKDFSNELIAQEQVVSVLDFDIHMERDFYGNRYIERITECVETNDGYIQNDIIIFKNQKYLLKNLPTTQMIEKMKKELKKEDKDEFEKFLDEVVSNEKYLCIT